MSKTETVSINYVPSVLEIYIKIEISGIMWFKIEFKKSSTRNWMGNQKEGNIFQQSEFLSQGVEKKP